MPWGACIERGGYGHNRPVGLLMAIIRYVIIVRLVCGAGLGRIFVFVADGMFVRIRMMIRYEVRRSCSFFYYCCFATR